MVFNTLRERQPLQCFKHLGGWSHIINFENDSRCPFLEFMYPVYVFVRSTTPYDATKVENW